MNKLDFMKLAELFDEGIDLSEFTPEELREFIMQSDNERLKQKYYDFYDDVKDKSLKKQDW
jgi:hypothetical protein